MAQAAHLSPDVPIRTINALTRGPGYSSGPAVFILDIRHRLRSLPACPAHSLQAIDPFPVPASEPKNGDTDPYGFAVLFVDLTFPCREKGVSIGPSYLYTRMRQLDNSTSGRFARMEGKRNEELSQQFEGAD
jgi:hypothetical protein